MIRSTATANTPDPSGGLKSFSCCALTRYTFHLGESTHTTGETTGSMSRLSPRPRRDVVSLLVLVLVACIAGCTRATSEPPDVILIQIAGLRADGGVRGAEAAFSDALGTPPGRNYRFAYAVSPRPLLSIASTLTGLYPTAIPYCGVVNLPAGPPSEPWCSQIPASVRSLPEVLALYGYDTAWMTDGLIGAQTLDDAFQTTHHRGLPGDGTPWVPLTTAVHTWWAAHQSAPRLLVLAVDPLATERTFHATNPESLEALEASYVDRSPLSATLFYWNGHSTFPCAFSQNPTKQCTTSWSSPT